MFTVKGLGAFKPDVSRVTNGPLSSDGAKTSPSRDQNHTCDPLLLASLPLALKAFGCPSSPAINSPLSLAIDLP